MSRVLIFGTGSVGSVYGYILQQAGCEITCVCRSNYQAAKANGFTINSSAWGKDLKFRPGHVVDAVPDVSATRNPFDYVLVTAKALPGTIPATIKPAVAKGTTIVILQNGIAVEDEYREAFPAAHLVSGTVYLPVTQISPAVFDHGSLERLELGTFPAHAEESAKTACENFGALIRKGGATANVFDDVQGMRWSKLMVNASWNGLCALSRSSDIAFLQADEDAWKTVRDVMQEVRQVGLAAGYHKELAEDTFNHQLQRFKVRAEKGEDPREPSMLADVKHERRMEVEAIFGNCLKKAREFNLDCPRLQTMYILVKALDQSFTRR